jgi:hypothetical protein
MCPFKCILYDRQYSALDRCPKCKEDRFKKRNNDVIKSQIRAIDLELSELNSEVRNFNRAKKRLQRRKNM